MHHASILKLCMCCTQGRTHAHLELLFAQLVMKWYMQESSLLPLQACPKCLRLRTHVGRLASDKL